MIELDSLRNMCAKCGNTSQKKAMFTGNTSIPTCLSKKVKDKIKQTQYLLAHGTPVAVLRVSCVQVDVVMIMLEYGMNIGCAISFHSFGQNLKYIVSLKIY